MKPGLFQAWSRDARGEVVPLISCNVSPFKWGVGPLPPDVQKLVRDEMRAFPAATLRDRGSWRLIPLALTPAAGMALTLIPTMALGGGWRALAAVPLYFVLIAGFLIASRHVGVWVMPDRFRSKFAASVASRGYCPSCGHFLADLPTGQDDLVLCPECGAAWRVGAGSDAR